MQTWEYLVIGPGIRTPRPEPIENDEINNIGKEGWELTSTLSYQDSDSYTRFVYIFKKPKEED
jgi:hypothetical protein